MTRDHGGGVDAAIAKWGGCRADWMDLSTGINPTPYPLPTIPEAAWTALPDQAAHEALIDAARLAWDVPDTCEIVAAPGASALIAALPRVLKGETVEIPTPTYNEHAAAFEAQGWTFAAPADVTVLVHPNNPNGKLWSQMPDTASVRVIDESFCDTDPGQTTLPAIRPGDVILKSFGKFWGLAGMRLGFAITDPVNAARLSAAIGPWAVSGPALQIGAAALADLDWSATTRTRLAADSAQLDACLKGAGLKVIGGTRLFRLAEGDAPHVAQTLAKHRILVRTFPYSERWIRFGLPPADGWDRLGTALEDLA